MVTVTGWGGSSKPYSREFSGNLRRHPHFNFKKVLEFMTRPLSQTFGLHVNKNKSDFPAKNPTQFFRPTNVYIISIFKQWSQKKSPTTCFCHQKKSWEKSQPQLFQVPRASTRSNTMVPALHASGKKLYSTVVFQRQPKVMNKSFHVVGCGDL